MRRAIPSFTVEVRRRPRLATTSSQDAQSSDAKTRPAAFERESHRVAAATFGAKTSTQPSGDGAASQPRGRILQSLVPEKATGGQLQDARFSAATSNPMSRAQKPPSVRAPKGEDQKSRLPRTVEASSDLTPQLADGSSVASVPQSVESPSDETAVSPGMPTATSNSSRRTLRRSGAAPKAETEGPNSDRSRWQPSRSFRQRSTIHYSNGLVGDTPDGRRRRFASKSKANHHGSLCLRR